MTLLLSVDEADFNYLKEKTNATAGNISVQLDKLSSAGYIEVTKEFIGKKTRTSCRMTEAGRKARKEDKNFVPYNRSRNKGFRGICGSIKDVY